MAAGGSRNVRNEHATIVGFAPGPTICTFDMGLKTGGVGDTPHASTCPWAPRIRLGPASSRGIHSWPWSKKSYWDVSEK